MNQETPGGFIGRFLITATLIVIATVLTRPAWAVPFHILTEGDPGTNGNFRIRTYNSLAELLVLNQHSTTLLGSNLGGTGVSIRGFAADFDFELTPRPVPAPATVWLMLMSLGGLGLFRWRRRTVTA